MLCLPLCTCDTQSYDMKSDETMSKKLLLFLTAFTSR